MQYGDHKPTGRDFASAHDATIAQALAEVMCGGAVTPGTTISEQQWLDLERAAFLRLVACKPSQARMRHMLKNGQTISELEERHMQPTQAYIIGATRSAVTKHIKGFQPHAPGSLLLH